MANGMRMADTRIRPRDRTRVYHAIRRGVPQCRSGRFQDVRPAFLPDEAASGKKAGRTGPGTRALAEFDPVAPARAQFALKLLGDVGVEQVEVNHLGEDVR